MFLPFHFEENIKYCPFCGRKVIRYAKPKYVEEIDWSWLEEYNEIIEKTYNFLQYKIHCNMTGKQIKELEEKSPKRQYNIKKLEKKYKNSVKLNFFLGFTTIITATLMLILV